MREGSQPECPLGKPHVDRPLFESAFEYVFPSEDRGDFSGADNQVDFKAVQIVLHVVLAVPAINVHPLIAGKEALNFNHGSAPLLRFDSFSCPQRIGVVVRRQQDDKRTAPLFFSEVSLQQPTSRILGAVWHVVSR